jgi:hypothetical protein
MSLAISCIAIMWVKRLHEHPRRKTLVWILDLSKQCFGGIAGHFLNIYVSTVFADMPGSLDATDECQWYFINYIVDISVGTLINVILIEITDELAYRMRCSRVGDYELSDGHISLRIWGIQLFHWFCILSVSKSIVILIFVYLRGTLEWVFSIPFHSLVNHPQIELLVVIFLVPLVSNILQFWVQDSFLQKKESSQSLVLSHSTSGSSKFDDEDDPAARLIGGKSVEMKTPVHRNRIV